MNDAGLMRLVAFAAVTVGGLVAATMVSVARLLQWLPLMPDTAHGVRVKDAVVAAAASGRGKARGGADSGAGAGTAI